MIHPTAIIHPKARLDPTAQVGPFCVIDEQVELGPECVLSPYVHLTGRTVIGRGNRFHAGCVIGDAPQDLKYSGALTGARIGNDNVFREYVTVHRSSKPEEETVIGSNNFFMANAHVGHNSHVGNHVILANGVLLGGHVVVEDRAFLSGNCAVHQFCRVGTLAMMQGCSPASLDIPPFTIMHETNLLAGLNTVGMRRAGLSSEDRLELRKLYHHLFMSGKLLRAAVQSARELFQRPASRLMIDFIAASKRGVCTHRARRRAAETAEPGA